MSPPMSQTSVETSAVLPIFFPSGKKSSTLAIMQTKAEGSKMRPTRRAHFPVQHMLLSPLLEGEYTLPTERLCQSRIREWRVDPG